MVVVKQVVKFETSIVLIMTQAGEVMASEMKIIHENGKSFIFVIVLKKIQKNDA